MNIPSIKDNPIFYIGLLVAFEQAISGGTIHLTNMIPATWIPVATAWATALAFIGNGFMTALAAPSLARPPSQTVAKVLAWLIVPLALLLLFAPAAHAQDRRGGAPAAHDNPNGLQVIQQKVDQAVQRTTGIKPDGTPTKNDTDDLWQKIANLTKPDLDYAIKLANNAGTPGAKIRGQCWQAILDANQQAAGTALKDANGNVLLPPSPDLFTKIERAGEIIDNLQPTAPLMSQCAAAANAVRMGTLQFITTVVTGLAGSAALVQ